MILMAERFDAARKKEFLRLLANGVRRGHAGAKVGISRKTFSNHMNKYPKFAEAVLQAEMNANELVEQALFKNAMDGNVTAQQVWLYNRDPVQWQDRRNVTVGGDKNNPVELKLSGDELNAEIKRLVNIASKAIATIADSEGEK